MRDNLDGTAQEVAAPFFANDLCIHLTGGHIADLAQAHVNETLIMPKIQVGLGPVIQYEDLAVLIGAHCARVNIDIGIQFLNGDVEPAFFEQTSRCCCRYAFANRTDHTTGIEDIFSGH